MGLYRTVKSNGLPLLHALLVVREIVADKPQETSFVCGEAQRGKEVPRFRSTGNEDMIWAHDVNFVYGCCFHWGIRLMRRRRNNQEPRKEIMFSWGSTPEPDLNDEPSRDDGKNGEN